MKILIATEKAFAPTAVMQIKEIIENAGFKPLLLENYKEKDQLLEAVKEANAMIVRSDKVDKEILNAAKNMKIVVRAGSGYDNIDVNTATEKGICVMNTPGQNSNAVAELVFGMLIYVLRSGYDGSLGTELKGKTIGLHGFGHIAKITAKLANGFGMKVYAFSPSLAKNPELGEVYDVIAVNTVEELYDNCDIVSLHLPNNVSTKGVVNYELLSRLPQDGVIINTARKEVINEQELIKIMNERQHFKYATDTKATDHDTMVSKFNNRYLASAKKCGAQTSEANINAGLAATVQIVKFFVDNDESFRVN